MAILLLAIDSKEAAIALLREEQASVWHIHNFNNYAAGEGGSSLEDSLLRVIHHHHLILIFKLLNLKL